jgi:arsenical-resistance protein 2
MADSTNPPDWYDVFPAPRSTAPLISRETVLSQLYSPDLLLIDVRRTDYEGGTIAGSLNIPAQSFYWNREALYNLCKRAGIKRVAFYCGKPMFSD